MNLLYADILLLLLTWFAGITTDVAGVIIHLLPVLACTAVLLRWYETPNDVNLVVNTSAVRKKF